MGKKSDDDYRFSENAIEWLSGERYATVTVSQRKWIELITRIAKVKKLKNIVINTDNTVTARVPADWIRIIPKGEDQPKNGN